MRILFFFIAAVVFVCFPSWAKSAAVYLKNGQVLEGEIVERNDFYIKVIEPEQGVPLIYLLFEIEKIDMGTEYPPDGAPETVERYKCDYTVYENTELGFKVSVPAGWEKNDIPVKHPLDSDEMKLLSKTVFTPDEKNAVPYVWIRVFKTENDKDLVRMVKDMTRLVAISAREKGTFGYRMKVKPVELSRGTQQYVQATVFYVPGVGGKYVSGREITIIDNYFPGRGYVVCFSLGVYSAECSQYSGVNEKAVETFVFTGQ
jgi:hypothetical protein